jgi:hypothetical protein
MDILLYKDGHLAISESPLEGKENNLDDVVMLVTNPQDGDTLTYKSGKWVNGEGGGGGSFAPDITNPQDGDTLVYNATAGKWVNGSGGGGGAMLLTVTETVVGKDTTYTLNKTWNEIKDALAEGTYVVLYGENPLGGYGHFTVASVWSAEREYGIENINVVSGSAYESAVLGVQNKTFKADSADGYPVVVIKDK